MNSLEIRNRKIIDAVIRKEQAVCPGAIALIGIYGSFQTGDIHPLSDLDLLILINDDRGWQLGKAFIQEDLGVGHDIYCTTRESLRQDAEYDHPHISKLMDAQIVYCADEKYRIELETLREQVRKKLAEPFGEEDYRKAEKELKEALDSGDEAKIEAAKIKILDAQKALLDNRIEGVKSINKILTKEQQEKFRQVLKDHIEEFKKGHHGKRGPRESGPTPPPRTGSPAP